mmetsp:Transcript_5245/g.17656  ORF Transcript_5245/g.17656 Transcript_5245/m.17656 type:complete len:201 (+) Transcript_5245:242-844(+)
MVGDTPAPGIRAPSGGAAARAVWQGASLCAWARVPAPAVEAPHAWQAGRRHRRRAPASRCTPSACAGCRTSGTLQHGACHEHTPPRKRSAAAGRGPRRIRDATGHLQHAATPGGMASPWPRWLRPPSGPSWRPCPTTIAKPRGIQGSIPSNSTQFWATRRARPHSHCHLGAAAHSVSGNTRKSCYLFGHYCHTYILLRFC